MPDRDAIEVGLSTSRGFLSLDADHGCVCAMYSGEDTSTISAGLTSFESSSRSPVRTRCAVSEASPIVCYGLISRSTYVKYVGSI